MGASSTRRKLLVFRFPRYTGPRPHRFHLGGSQPQRATELIAIFLDVELDMDRMLMAWQEAIFGLYLSVYKIEAMVVEDMPR
jgi:hypothetical protein